MKKRIPFFAFIFFYLIFSFATYRDYGSTWDEQDTYQGGADLYQYLIHGVPMAYLDPEHSYPYTFPSQRFITGPTNYEAFHLLNLLFSSLLFWAVFETLFSACGSARWAGSGPVFLLPPASFFGVYPRQSQGTYPSAVFYFLSLAVIYLFERKFPGLKFRWFFLGAFIRDDPELKDRGFHLVPDPPFL